MRELCSTYTGEAPEHDEVAREVRPIFEPKWDAPQWYEFKDGRPRRRWRSARSTDGEGQPDVEGGEDGPASEGGGPEGQGDGR